MSLIQLRNSPATIFTKSTDLDGELHFNFVGQQYTTNADVVVHDTCNSVTIINKGTLVAYINGIPLKPPVDPELSGESVAIGGNKGELFKGRLQVVITPGDPAPMVVIIQKFYTP